MISFSGMFQEGSNFQANADDKGKVLYTYNHDIMEARTVRRSKAACFPEIVTRRRVVSPTFRSLCLPVESPMES